MPDGVVAGARPHLARVGRILDAVRVARPVHRDLRRRRERRHRNPDERFASRVPRVGLEGKDGIVSVREPEVRGGRAILVEEALGRVVGKPHEDGEVLKGRRGRGGEGKLALVDAGSGRDPLRLERRHGRVRTGGEVVRRGEPAGVGRLLGEVLERDRERRRNDALVAERDGAYRGAVSIDEIDVGRGRAFAERAQLAGDDRVRRRHIRDGDRAEAQDLTAGLHVAEGDVVRRRHGLVFLGDPRAGRGDVADADFVEVAAEGLRMARERAETEAVGEGDRIIADALVEVSVGAANVAGEVGVKDARDVPPRVVGESVVVVERIVAARCHNVGVARPGRDATIPPAGAETDNAVVSAFGGRLKEGDRERPDRRAGSEGRGNDEAAGLAVVVVQLVHHRVAGRRRGGRDAGVGDRHRVGVGLVRLVGVPAACGGVGSVMKTIILENLVHVPDADVVRARPHLRRGGEARRRAAGVPVHRDSCRRGERWDGYPNQRLARSVPGIDVAGNRVVVLVREPD